MGCLRNMPFHYSQVLPPAHCKKGPHTPTGFPLELASLSKPQPAAAREAITNQTTLAHFRFQTVFFHTLIERKFRSHGRVMRRGTYCPARDTSQGKINLFFLFQRLLSMRPSRGIVLWVIWSMFVYVNRQRKKKDVFIIFIFIFCCRALPRPIRIVAHP